MSAQQKESLFDEMPPVAGVRRSDPRTAKVAAGKDPKGREYQKLLMIRHLAKEETATADDLAAVIKRHRSVASTRLNVLRKLGHAEKCGVTPRTDEYGHKRDVELWRATPDGAAWLAEVDR